MSIDLGPPTKTLCWSLRCRQPTGCRVAAIKRGYVAAIVSDGLAHDQTASLKWRLAVGDSDVFQDKEKVGQLSPTKL